MKRPTIEITQQFGFDAAHFLEQSPLRTNRRMHGHSFYAEVTLRGEPDPEKGWVRDFTEVNAALSEIRSELDHQLLNDLEGLGAPTLENLARYIYREAKSRLPEVCRVRLSRPSSGQSCVYEES
jgi:6-pyruvoyltetrahydropterin/6-carboxytetrahydropterin synthase